MIAEFADAGTGHSGPVKRNSDIYGLRSASGFQCFKRSISDALR
jgi:hypothetical protein